VVRILLRFIQNKKILYEIFVTGGRVRSKMAIFSVMN
jgi:hypothetical protein